LFVTVMDGAGASTWMLISGGGAVGGGGISTCGGGGGGGFGTIFSRSTSTFKTSGSFWIIVAARPETSA